MNQNIADLTGIEDFDSLQTLECDNNQLTTLDVSTNTALEYLHCKSNQLTTLDVSTNTTLERLECNNNQLTSLDLRNGNNANLNSIYALGNDYLSCI